MHTDFDQLLRRLSDARLRYEELRVTSGRYHDRADALTSLHELRAEAARSRSVR